MHTINFTIKKNHIKKDGTTPIYLQYNFSREKRTLIKTGKFIEPKYWNHNLKDVRRNHPEYEYISKYLRSIKLKLECIVDECILKGKTPTISYIDEQFTLSTSPEKNQKLNFFERYDEFTTSKKGQVVDDVIKDYNSLKKHLEGFQKHRKREIVFSDINPKFYDGFVDYLSYHAIKPNKEVGLRRSTVGKQIKNLKVFINYEVRNNYTQPIDISAFKTINSNATDIYITEQEIEDLLNLDFSQNIEFDRLRDLFVIGCETGMRFSDFSRLKRYHFNIDKGVISINMQKIGSRVVIPISTRLKAILKKYNYSPPNNITSHDFNKNIKTIGQLAKINSPVVKLKEVGNIKTEEVFLKYECMSSHTCRRSFCTNQFKQGMHSILIRRISGHSDERSFLKYIKIDEEEAAQMMLDFWMKIEKAKNLELK